MEQPADLPVVVIGGGPTGLTVATLLARYGVQVTVLEQYDAAYPLPRAVHLDDEAARVLTLLGLGDSFVGISRPALGLRLLDAEHRLVAEFRRDRLVTSNGFAQANMFDQPELERLLRDNLASSHPSVRLRPGCEVVDITPGRPATLTVRDTTTGTPEHVQAAYVLGCDGANGITRRSIGSNMIGLGFEQRWLVVDVRTGHDLDQWDGVHQICDARRAATYMRIGDDRHRWEFRLLDDETADDFGTIAQLRELLAPWVGDIDDVELELVRSAEYVFRAAVVDRWRDGSVFLLGDAAHLTPPFIGQGLGAGLRDAANLSWKLAAVVHGWADDAILDTYGAERSPHVRSLIRLAVLMGRLMTAGGDFGALARRTLAPHLHLVPGLRSKVVDSSTPRLRNGPLVRRRRRLGRDLAGTLAPNLTMAEGRRFDDVVGPHFAVVTTLGVSEQMASLVGLLRARLVPVGPSDELRHWLTGGRVDTAVVRPDRTVLAASAGESELHEVLTQLDRLFRG